MHTEEGGARNAREDGVYSNLSPTTVHASSVLPGVQVRPECLHLHRRQRESVQSFSSHSEKVSETIER